LKECTPWGSPLVVRVHCHSFRRAGTNNLPQAIGSGRNSGSRDPPP
jgi:cytochrome c peroxidase